MTIFNDPHLDHLSDQYFGELGENRREAIRISGLASLAFRAHCVRLSPLRGSDELPTHGFSEI
jgi:hypothetical protein